MSSQKLCPQMVEPKGRQVGSTEKTLCRAVPGGTGIAVVAILTSKALEASTFESALQRIQMSHPILRCRLHSDTSRNTFAFVQAPVAFLTIKTFDFPSTMDIIEKSLSDSQNHSISPFHLILEHELNQNAWLGPKDSKSVDIQDMFFATVYTLPDAKWVGVLRLHATACDRTTALSLLKELVVLATDEDGGGVHREIGHEGEVALGIEELIPKRKTNKAVWSRGLNMLSYSVNSLRLTNLKFMDAKSPRCSQAVRLQLNQHDAEKLITHCKREGIKLSGVLAAAGLIAARSSKNLPLHHREKYAVVTLVDCRSILDPVLTRNHVGFYHSAILNTHDVDGSEELWKLANRTYNAFANAKHNNKHFTDMGDLNFLMCKAIDNPGLTPSGALRTAFISVFEDPVIEQSNPAHQEIGVEDYMGCASVHGVGPSLALFDTIRDGRLDCACVYPSPLHSRQQMQKLIDDMKQILLDGCANLQSE